MKQILALFLLLFIALIVGGGYYFFSDTDKPVVSLTPDTGAASSKREYVVEATDNGKGLRQLSVVVMQGGRRVVVVNKNYENSPKSAKERFTLEKTDLRDGAFELRIEVRDNSIFNFGHGNTTTLSKDYTFDSKPPQITVLSIAHNVRQGGVGCVVYQVNEDTYSTGVMIADMFFPGFKQPNGFYACLFAFPIDMEPAKFHPKLRAEDLAGNERVTGFKYQAMPRKFKNDTLPISDNFLDSKMDQFKDIYPEIKTNLDLYIKVNNDLRVQNAQTLRQLGRQTAPRQLWQDAFMRLPNSAPRAGFGDRRTYNYNGKKIDEQTHMGVDLASLERSPVPAANNGTVIFTGFLGIYGNAVVIDHGLGLQTIYSHLSEITSKQGDSVKKGDTIGRTGATGLAGGDHLHFGVLVSGVEVSPIEWFDKHWIDDNVVGKFTDPGREPKAVASDEGAQGQPASGGEGKKASSGGKKGKGR